MYLRFQRMRTRVFLAVLSLLLLEAMAMGQTRYTGKVVDLTSGESIPGAIVLEKGTTNRTSTDVNGNFAIRINGKGVIDV